MYKHIRAYCLINTKNLPLWCLSCQTCPTDHRVKGIRVSPPLTVPSDYQTSTFVMSLLSKDVKLGSIFIGERKSPKHIDIVWSHALFAGQSRGLHHVGVHVLCTSRHSNLNDGLQKIKYVTALNCILDFWIHVQPLNEAILNLHNLLICIPSQEFFPNMQIKKEESYQQLLMLTIKNPFDWRAISNVKSTKSRIFS